MAIDTVPPVISGVGVADTLIFDCIDPVPVQPDNNRNRQLHFQYQYYTFYSFYTDTKIPMVLVQIDCLP
ncbi:MAG: hypothetical protein R2769_16645 [Saprospiraceae bacterium]